MNMNMNMNMKIMKKVVALAVVIGTLGMAGSALAAKMKNGYSMDIANAIKGFLVSENWRFSFNEKSGIFRFALGIGEKIKSIHYAINVKDDRYIVYAISPVSADPKDANMMAAMAEFVCRASYGLSNGNFELDFRDGELRYKSFVDCDGGAIPTRQIIKNSIYFPAFTFKHYTPGILAIIFNGASGEDAINKCKDKFFRMLDVLGMGLFELNDSVATTSSDADVK